MDIGEVKRRYGQRLALVGNIDCTELLPHGSLADVEAAVQETIAKASPGGGYVLASNNSMHPAVIAALRTHGKWSRGNYPLDPRFVLAEHTPPGTTSCL